jgi:hypothetical protein
LKIKHPQLIEIFYVLLVYCSYYITICFVSGGYDSSLKL